MPTPIRSFEVSYAPLPVGEVMVASSPQGVRAVSLGDSREALLSAFRQRLSGRVGISSDVSAAHHGYVDEILRGFMSRTPIHVPMDLAGSDFRRRVWMSLLKIPPGQTVSYGQLAGQLGFPTAHRSVASACAANELALIIPCHRVVRSDGALGGYRWGIERKRALLELEKTQDH